MASPPHAVTPIVIDLPMPTPMVLAAKHKGQAPAIFSVHRSPLFAIERGKALMTDAIRVAPVVDTRHHFPKQRLRKQFQEKTGSISLFPRVEDLQELLFSVIEEELGEDFRGHGGGSGDDLREEREWLSMIVLPTISEAWDSTTDIVAIQSKTPASSLLFGFYLSLASY